MDAFDDLPDDQTSLIEALMDAHGYDELTDTQKMAFDAGILDGGNHLLVAKTENGKTFCAEAVTKQTLDAGGRVAYLVPSRNLVGDKTEELNEWVTEMDYEISQGGAYEGAYKSGDIVIATFDSFYQAILRGVGGATSVDRVILDDFHEIYGSFRGPGIEKTIAALLDNRIPIFAMSATLGNPYQLANWMNANPVVSDEPREIEIVESPVEVQENESKINRITTFLNQKSDRAPFLVFNSSKRNCESRSESVAEAGVFADASNRDFTRELTTDILGEDIVPDRLEELADMMERGVAYHHATLPNDVREWIEDAFRNGDLKAIFCTTTIAYGFDAPVQSVVVSDLKRWNGNAMTYVGVYEYVQWIGRAARPGKGFDPGYAFPFYSDFDAASERFFGDRELEDVTSHIENDDTFRKFLLEMIEMGWDTPDKIKSFLKSTLYWEQLSPAGAFGRQRQDRETQLEAALSEHIEWLIDNDFITETLNSGFDTTDFGSAAVSFNFETFQDATLADIREFYNWLKSTPEFEYPQLFRRIISHFFEFPPYSMDDVADRVEDRITDLGLWEDDAAASTVVLIDYWMQNMRIDRIEDEAGVDPTYLSMEASNIADYMGSVEYLFDPLLNVEKPVTYDDVKTRVRHGVRTEEILAVKRVNHVGRVKIRNLHNRLNSTFPETDSEEILSRVAEIYNDDNYEEDQLDRTISDINGFGPVLTDRLKNEALSISDRAIERFTKRITADDIHGEAPDIVDVDGQDSVAESGADETVKSQNTAQSSSNQRSLDDF